MRGFPINRISPLDPIIHPLKIQGYSFERRRGIGLVPPTGRQSGNFLSSFPGSHLYPHPVTHPTVKHSPEFHFFINIIMSYKNENHYTEVLQKLNSDDLWRKSRFGTYQTSTDESRPTDPKSPRLPKYRFCLISNYHDSSVLYK